MIRHPRILQPVVFLVIAVLAIGPGLALDLANVRWVVDGVVLIAKRPEFLFILLAGSVAVWRLKFQAIAPACAIAQIGVLLVVENTDAVTQGNSANILWLMIFSLGAFLPSLAAAQILITVFGRKKSREGRP